jgi:nicotinate-nucleotide pyrophosphorylase (carboxylating)
MMEGIDLNRLDELITQSLQEDVGDGDITTGSVVAAGTRAEAVWIAKQDGIIGGLGIAEIVFRKLDPDLEWKACFSEGESVKSGNTLVEMTGSCRAVLTAERLALNLVQRISGIATATAGVVKQLDGTGTQVLDTRKTVPGLRVLDKYGVRIGGGRNHRMGLYDLAMIKDNHIVAAGGILQAVKKVRSAHPEVEIEVETTSLAEVEEALSAGADIIMLDNMPPERMARAVKQIDGRCRTEASGNITPETVREVARTGVDYISIGALTHTVTAFDISQKIKRIF